MSARSEAFRRTLAGVDNRCTCGSATDLFRHEIANTSAPPCPVHAADAVRQQQVDAEVAAIEAHAAPIRAALFAVQEADHQRELDRCSCVALTTKQLVKATIEGRTPAPCPLHDEPPPDSSLALNSDGLTQAIRTRLGLSPTPSDYQPPDAA